MWKIPKVSQSGRSRIFSLTDDRAVHGSLYTDDRAVVVALIFRNDNSLIMRRELTCIY